MDRRTFVGTVAGGIVLARSLAEAQSAAKVYRVGFLLGATRESVASLFDALRDGMRGLGYVDLHDLLPPELFVDSLHVTAEGHHRIAEQLAPVVETMLRDLGEHRSAAAASHAP